MPLFNPPSLLGSILGNSQLNSNTNVTGSVADVLTLNITLSSPGTIFIVAPTRYSATLAGLASILLTVNSNTVDTAAVSVTLLGNGATTLTNGIALSVGSHTIKIRGSVTVGTLTFLNTGTSIYAQLVG